MKKSKVKKFLLLLLINLFLVAGLIEISVRILGLAPTKNAQYQIFKKGEKLPYVLKENLKRQVKTQEFSYPLVHNKQGFRDRRNYQKQKPIGTFRIVGLGDSFTYGGGAPFEKTYLRVLEKKLQQKFAESPKIEVLKMGVPRYWAELERIMLETRGLEYDPDLILVGFLSNDILDTFWKKDGVKVSEDGFLITQNALKLGSVGRWLYDYSHTMRIIFQFYLSTPPSPDLIPRHQEIFIENGFHEKDWQKLESEYQKIVELGKQHGAPTVIIYIPKKPPWEENISYAAQRMSKWCAKHDAHFINTFPALKKAHEQGKKLYHPIDGHCNGEGYTIVGETVFEKLLEKNLIPTSNH